jgi:CheY-like chemotaxis protein
VLAIAACWTIFAGSRRTVQNKCTSHLAIAGFALQSGPEVSDRTAEFEDYERGTLIAFQEDDKAQLQERAMNRKTRVLVVDDDEVVRSSYVRTLKSTSCEVEAVLDGDRALRAMEAESFDVVLLDLRMPGMNGMSVLETIKRRWPGSQVVIITGYPSIETAKEAVRLGAYDYLAKPVGPPDVLKATYGAATQKGWMLRADGENSRMAC